MRLDIDLVVHGHFYQPPREDPWSGEVPQEFGAAPFHDWNERIAFECYRPFAAARVTSREGILECLNDFAHASFDLGPTLGAWLDAHEPWVVRRAIEGDRAAVRRSGHGNAIAHPYFHVILPLADPLDRATLIRWGLIEFHRRFGRAARGFWLPETAVDHATLGDLIDHGVEFVVLAPGQAARTRPLRAPDWNAHHSGARLDTSRPYRYLHPDRSGRSVDVFFYDGPLAQALAFGGALRSTEALVAELAAAAARSSGGLVHVAVDGETFGHHARYGERVLAHAVSQAFGLLGVRVLSYGEARERHPATHEVDLYLGEDGRGSSWSCAHGIGRWMRDCGCRLRPGSTQEWRSPLRDAFDLLNERGRAVYLDTTADLLHDPWAARDAYVEVILGGSFEAFLSTHAVADLSADERRRLAEALALQHDLLAMFTSCGWFFDDVSGLETALVMRWAGRAIDRMERLTGHSPHEEFLDRLVGFRAWQDDRRGGTQSASDPSSHGASSPSPGVTAADVFESVSHPLARSRSALGPAVDGDARREWRRTFRRWLRGGAAADVAALRILERLRGAESLDLRDLERARDQFCSEVLERRADTPYPPRSIEIGAGLGFAPSALRMLPVSPPSDPASPPSNRSSGAENDT
jgi:hypothetical protein